MLVTSNEEDTIFTPITISIYIETEEELKSFHKGMEDSTGRIPYLIYKELEEIASHKKIKL